MYKTIVIQEFKIKPVLMATADSYALMISRNADLLKEYYHFPAMPDGLLEKIIDKKGLAELVEHHQLKGPMTLCPFHLW